VCFLTAYSLGFNSVAENRPVNGALRKPRGLERCGASSGQMPATDLGSRKQREPSTSTNVTATLSLGSVGAIRSIQHSRTPAAMRVAEVTAPCA